MTINQHFTIDQVYQHEIEPIKKSRFIAFLYPFEEAKNLSTYRQETAMHFPQAVHHCWAYQIRKNNQIRFNDDGEPSGSAGKPILNHLQGKNICNALLIVSRIFGGCKLGVGGLVRAYGKAANEVIALADLMPHILTKKLYITYTYNDTAIVQQAFHRLAITPGNEIFDKEITCRVDLPIDKYEGISTLISELCHNRIKLAAK